MISDLCFWKRRSMEIIFVPVRKIMLGVKGLQ
jgi:hypothetical protein